MAKTQKELKITVICCNPECDRKFSFLLSTVEKPRPIFLSEDGAELGRRLITPKTYVVPCPYCGTENEVDLP